MQVNNFINKIKIQRLLLKKNLSIKTNSLFLMFIYNKSPEYFLIHDNQVDLLLFLLIIYVKIVQFAFIFYARLLLSNLS